MYPFTVAEDKLLIHHVRQHHALYDSRHSDYKNQDARDDIWAKISESINKDASDCKKRWRSIRDTFFRCQRQYQRQVSSGRRLRKPRWTLLEHLTFLNNFPSDKRNAAIRQIEGTIGADFTQHIIKDIIKRDPLETKKFTGNDNPSLPLRNRTKDQNENVEVCAKKRRLDDEYDPVLTFFRSMALTVKSFDPELITEAKTRVFSVVMELEQRTLQARNNSYFVKVEPEDGEGITLEETQVTNIENGES